MSGIVSSTMNAAAMPVAQLAEFFHRSRRGLPKSADGLSDAQAAPRVEGKKDDEVFLLKVVKGLNGQIKRGLPLPASALPSLLDAILHAKTHTGIDDRKLLLEYILAFMSRLPPGSLQNRIQDEVIGLFYESLPHPPVDFLPSMMVEMKIPTVVAGNQLGPGGVGVSEGGIGRTGIVAGGQDASTSPSAPSVAEMPSTLRQILHLSSGQTQLPTPTPSGFINRGSQVSPGTGYNPAHTGSGTLPNGQSQTSASTPLPRKAYSSQFRNPSGAQNNPHMPLLGAAGTAYARSVCPQHPMPASSLPDPDMVFELLMRRRPPPEAANPASPQYDPRVAEEFRGQGHGQPHPSGLSTMLFAFGDLIIHSLFRTSHKDPSVNMTSSYLDLSPLYGVDEAEMAGVRRNDGTGRIWEDIWADPRIALMPPAVGALLVVFSRNHNHVALRLLEINEYGTYTSPTRPPPKSNRVNAKEFFPGLSEEKLTHQDDDIFNRARLINCAFFMNAILGDYLSGILGTFREASEWYLNPLAECRKGGKTSVNRAEGNSVSVEFNLLYRWHATLTEKDEQWLEGALKAALPNSPAIQQMPSGEMELTEQDFAIAAANATRAEGLDPKVWTLGGLSRTEDGGFSDYELARILHGATTTMARAYGARGIPAVMKAVEVMGIKQARKWGVCTMNEFRKFVGLKQYESFEEWNPTGDIAETARKLYQHIDNLELYVGLMCEESKKPGDGAGLCPGYTISRAILADAVCLTRGDRFLTTDLTPFNLTSWGYQDCARDTKNGSMGGMISKLLFRTLPEYYPEGSVLAHFPFITPDEMKKWLTKMNLIDRYNFNTLPSAPVRPILSINSARGTAHVLKDMRGFKSVYSTSLNTITDGQGCFLSFDEEPRHHLGRTIIGNTLYRDGAMKAYAGYFEAHTRRLIHERSFSIGGKRRAVNIVRDIINIVPVHWICEEIAGLPLKSTEAIGGTLNEQEIYEKASTIFAFIFLNNEPENAWPLCENSKKYARQLLGYIMERLQGVQGWESMFSIRGIRNSIADTFRHRVTGELDHSDAFYRALLDNNGSALTLDQLSYNVLGLIVTAVAQFSQATTHVVDFYLNPEHATHKEEIEALAVEHTAEADALLVGYVREALRLNPQAPGVFKKATADSAIEEGNGLPKVAAKNNDRIFVSLAKAHVDPDSFPNPNTLNPKRPKEQYYSFGRSEYSCFDELFTESMIPAALRAIFSHKNVQRGPKYTGELKRFRDDTVDSEHYLYISNTGTITPYPSSLLLTYDDVVSAPGS